ncbi:MAG: matrixin family metalloprotease [bacterium]|nr:matrixin family metalloprotease [bacterium]
MKKILVFILFLIVVLVIASRLDVSFLDNFFTYSFCDKPIRYRVDTVDPKFNLSRDAFVADINQAAQIWNNDRDKNLFIYDPKGDLSINLVYDERQSLTSQINQLENKVKSDIQALNPQVSEYKRLSADFKQKLADLNSQIESWNNQGGAPPDEYQKLIKQQQDLQAEVSTLNEMARSLDISADVYNAQVSNLNQTINTFNSVLEERPEEGIFKGPENRIEIYFNISKPELVHTIAHELGHALGIGHISNPAAIMYPKTSQKIKLTNEDIAVLEDVCKRYSFFELIQMRLAQMVAYYQQVLKLSPN